jgi:hypothetical protein
MAEADALRHIHLKTAKIDRVQDAIHGRLPLFQNADVRISRSRPALQQEFFYRNAAQDELWFVRSGTGRLLSMFGSVPFRDFDYLVIPRCTTIRIEFDAIDQADLLIVESEPFGPGRSRREELRRIRRALSRFHVPKDVLLYSRPEIDRWMTAPNHVIRKAYREGRVLYGHE